MKTINIKPPLTSTDVNYINELSKTEKVLLVAKNTRGFNKDLISTLDDSVKISIIGGLDPSKKKFNNNYYRNRTIYSPKELALIIGKFEEIERNINPLWSNLEKVMFVYKTLCEYSTYEENNYNNRDAARNLLGMITGKSVCSGFALIFKEAMDRIGVECIYQNVESHHSWNIIKLDGKYRSIELTWDTYNKKDNTCGFACFCREDKESFYSNEHHNLKYEDEEIEYPVESISTEELVKCLNNISKAKILAVKPEIENGVTIFNVGKTTIQYRDGLLINPEYGLGTYRRKDWTSFLVYPTGKSGKGVYEYVYADYVEKENYLRATKIYSEMNLLQMDIEMRNKIANDLMSQKRMARKINGFNGYIGYVIPKDNNRYYNENFEQSELNKFR